MAKKDILRESLDDLIGDDNLMPITTDDTEGLPPIKPVQERDYVSMKSKAQAQASKTIDSLMRFYLSQEIIEDEEYIRAKKKMLKLQKGDILKTSASIKKLKKEINFQPKVSIKEGILKFIDWFKNYYNY